MPRTLDSSYNYSRTSYPNPEGSRSTTSLPTLAERAPRFVIIQQNETLHSLGFADRLPTAETHRVDPRYASGLQNESSFLTEASIDSSQTLPSHDYPPEREWTELRPTQRVLQHPTTVFHALTRLHR